MIHQPISKLQRRAHRRHSRATTITIHQRVPKFKRKGKESLQPSRTLLPSSVACWAGKAKIPSTLRISWVSLILLSGFLSGFNENPKILGLSLTRNSQRREGWTTQKNYIRKKVLCSRRNPSCEGVHQRPKKWRGKWEEQQSYVSTRDQGGESQRPDWLKEAQNQQRKMAVHRSLRKAAHGCPSVRKVHQRRAR